MDKKLKNNRINKNQNKNSSKQTNGFEPDNFDWKKASKTSFIWMAIILGAVYVSGLLTNGGKKEVEIEYTEYKEYLDNGEIAKGVIMGDIFHGEFKEAKILNFSPSFESSFSGRRDRESGEWFCKRRP